MPTLVDALPAIRSSRFDLPLTYDAGDLALAVGDVVRVPLGRREVLAYVVREPYEGEEREGLRTVSERLDVPRAFDDTGLALARFVADTYVCTLGEALGAIIRSESLPRMADVLVRRDREKAPRSVPRRLLDVIWDDFEERFQIGRAHV